MPYVIMNLTDGVPAGFYEWNTRQEAEECITKMRDTFRKVQGYYKTVSGARIDPSEVEYEILEIENEES